MIEVLIQTFTIPYIDVMNQLLNNYYLLVSNDKYI